MADVFFLYNAANPLREFACARMPGSLEVRLRLSQTPSYPPHITRQVADEQVLPSGGILHLLMSVFAAIKTQTILLFIEARVCDVATFEEFTSILTK